MLKIQWMNGNGFYSVPFNSVRYTIDPLGYLDMLRDGEDMEDLHVIDGAGQDVSLTYL